MAQGISHSFVLASLALARASVQSAVQFVVVFGTEKQRARGSPRQREGGEEDSHFPFSGGRKVGSLFARRTLVMAQFTAWETKREREGARLRNERNVELPFAVA